jgi:serine/threonine protein kinase
MAWLLGTLLDRRYRVLGTLGQGAMGTVYLVEHLEHGRKEALKLLRPAEFMSAVESASRFRREARAIHRLRHPNIIALHGFGRLPDLRLYLSMEYVEGRDLATVGRRRLAPARAVPLLMQLADGIDHAHARGVVHRDLKPANLVVTMDAGRELVKILDFGVAKIVDPLYRDSVLSAMRGDVLGTPAYLAPEQLTGTTDDPRIDIYAFGCLAFKLLTGTAPFSGRAMEVLQAHIHQPAPRLRERCPEAEIPGELEALVHRCLAKRPEDRIQSGGEIRRALRSMLEGSAAAAPGERALEGECTTTTS